MDEEAELMAELDDGRVAEEELSYMYLSSVAARPSLLSPAAASGRSLSLGRSEGLTKVIFDEQTKRVIGAGIVGPNAGDLIAEVALAIEMDCEASDIGATIHPHPTLSETIAFAAEAFEGTITDLYLPRRKQAD